MPPPFLRQSMAVSISEPASHAEVADLARAYGRQVFQTAYRILGNAAQAEDVQQDVFLRLLEAPVPAVASWPAWLRAMAARMAIDRLRRATRWQRLLPLAMATTAAPDTAAPEQQTDAVQQAARLRALLPRLPRLQAQCFTLRCIEGQEIDAIAAGLGITSNHARVALHRATHRLERLLAGALPTSEENQQ